MRLTSSGGMDIEDIRGYNHLHHILANVKYCYSSRSARRGEGFGQAGNGVGEIVLQSLNVAGSSMMVHIPLMSALIGSSSSKYFPIFLAQQLMLEIELASNCFISTSAANPQPTSYSISNVALNCQIIEFPQEVNESLLRMVASSGIYLHAITFLNFVQSFPVGTTNPVIVINERLKSVKSILNVFTPSSRANSLRRMFGHISNAISGYQVKIGSDLYPIRQIGGNNANSDSYLMNSDFVTQTLTALGEFNNIHAQSMMNVESFSYCTAGDNTYGISTAAEVNRSMYGIDLDCFSMSPIESGLNAVIASPISINFTGGNQTIAYDVHTFIMHDVLFSLLPNGSFVVSK